MLRAREDPAGPWTGYPSCYSAAHPATGAEHLPVRSGQRSADREYAYQLRTQFPFGPRAHDPGTPAVRRDAPGWRDKSMRNGGLAEEEVSAAREAREAERLARIGVVPDAEAEQKKAPSLRNRREGVNIEPGKVRLLQAVTILFLLGCRFVTRVVCIKTAPCTSNVLARCAKGRVNLAADCANRSTDTTDCRHD